MMVVSDDSETEPGGGVGSTTIRDGPAQERGRRVEHAEGSEVRWAWSGDPEAGVSNLSERAVEKP